MPVSGIAAAATPQPAASADRRQRSGHHKHNDSDIDGLDQRRRRAKLDRHAGSKLDIRPAESAACSTSGYARVVSRARGGAGDIPALMRLKRLLAEGEDSLHAVRATEADWLRDGFGADAGFTAFVAEDAATRHVIGMATCSRRIITGWNGPVIFLQDLSSSRRIASTASPAR